jgi:hypothetical protein
MLAHQLTANWLYLDNHYPTHDGGQIADYVSVSSAHSTYVLFAFLGIHIMPFSMFVEMIFESDLPTI